MRISYIMPSVLLSGLMAIPVSASIVHQNYNPTTIGPDTNDVADWGSISYSRIADSFTLPVASTVTGFTALVRGPQNVAVDDMSGGVWEIGQVVSGLRAPLFGGRFNPANVQTSPSAQLYYYLPADGNSQLLPAAIYGYSATLTDNVGNSVSLSLSPGVQYYFAFNTPWGRNLGQAMHPLYQFNSTFGGGPMFGPNLGNFGGENLFYNADLAFNLVPTPSTIAALALGGLAANRRRR